MTDSANKELIDGLNTDLSHEYQAILMYNSYAAMVYGMHRPTLKQFFESELPEELNHAQLLADKITAMGGTPTTEPAPLELVTEPKEMLKQAMEAEADTERERAAAQAVRRLSASATEAQRAEVRELALALYDERQALEARDEALAEGADLTRSLRTATERYSDEMERLNALLSAGATKPCCATQNPSGISPTVRALRGSARKMLRPNATIAHTPSSRSVRRSCLRQ